MLKLLLGALNALRNQGVSSAEIKRCRTIVSTARSYLTMLKTYEKTAEMEQWLVNTQSKLLQLTEDQLKHCEAPAEKARLVREIAHMKEFIEKSPYKPFEKKPSLISPYSNGM